MSLKPGFREDRRQKAQIEIQKIPFKHKNLLLFGWSNKEGWIR